MISGGSTALYAGWREGLQQLGEAHPGAGNREVPFAREVKGVRFDG